MSDVPNVATVFGLSFNDCPFFFCDLCLMYPMLPVSLDCLLMIVPLFFYDLCLMYPMLPVSLGCLLMIAHLVFPLPVSYVPNVASVFRLSFNVLPLWFSVTFIYTLFVGGFVLFIFLVHGFLFY